MDIIKTDYAALPYVMCPVCDRWQLVPEGVTQIDCIGCKTTFSFDVPGQGD